MEDKLDSILEYLAGLKHGQEELQKNQRILLQSQNRLEEKLDNLALETRSGFRHTRLSLDDHQEVFSLVSDQIRNLQTEVDYLSGKTGLHDTKINSLERKLQPHI